MAENRELALVLKLVADNFSSELKKQQGALGSFNNFIKDWKTQLAAVGGALFAIAKSTANYGEELLKTSQKVGINVQALAGLQHAANLADLDNAQLAQGLKFLSVNMVEAGKKSGDGAALFRSLGISAMTASGQLRPTEEVLLDVADAFAKSKDGAGKTEMAVKMFGKAGLELIPFLNQGKQGIKELMEEARRLGLVMSKEDAEAANKFNDELKKLAAASRGLTLVLGKELVPVFTMMLTGVTTLVNSGFVTFLKEVAFHMESLGISSRLAGEQLVMLFKNPMAMFSTDNAKALGAQMDALALVAQGKRNDLRADLFSGGAETFGPPKPTSTGGSAGPRQELALLADQEKLAKALVEIWQSNFRSIEDHNKRIREEAEGRLSLEALAFDRQEQFRKEDEAYQESRGRMIVAQTSEQVRIRHEAMSREREDLIANEAAWVAHFEELGGDEQDLYTHKMDLLRAHLAKELDLNQRQAATLLMAWQTHDSARAEAIMADSPKSDLQKHTIELNATRQATQHLNEASGDFFTGWASGMRNYVRDTKSGFGLAADMARRTAQAMEQGFKNFFFDAMEGKIKGMKDVFKSLLDFAKQIISQIMAQMVMAGIAKSFASGLGGGMGANAGGGNWAATSFSAANGMVGNFGAGTMGMLHGIEAVVPLPDGKSIPVTMRSMGGNSPSVSVPIHIEVINQVQGAKVDTQQSTGADGRQQIRLIVRQEMKSAFGDGSMDKDMRRFGSSPQPIGR